MPCKHEGGVDPCARNASKTCKVWKRMYYRANMRHTGRSSRESRDRGAAGEHLVISELLSRQLPTGGPYNLNGAHDLFVKVSGGWKTVQVKLGRLNLKTGVLQLQNRKAHISSNLIAVVDLEGKRIRWISNTDEPVPEELCEPNTSSTTCTPAT